LTRKPFSRRTNGAERFLAVNALLFARFDLAGVGVWFFGVWLVGMASWLSLVTRIRNIAEHACTSTGEDPFSHARTTLANPIERALIAPYWVNYHAEHHLFMYLPCYRLAEAHRLLVAKGPHQADGRAAWLCRRDANSHVWLELGHSGSCCEVRMMR
jgi:fatty acid desaturase